jgi:hypothetical protein
MGRTLRKANNLSGHVMLCARFIYRSDTIPLSNWAVSPFEVLAFGTIIEEITL